MLPPEPSTGQSWAPVGYQLTWIIQLFRVKFKINLQYNEAGEKDDHEAHELGCF